MVVQWHKEGLAEEACRASSRANKDIPTGLPLMGSRNTLVEDTCMGLTIMGPSKRVLFKRKNKFSNITLWYFQGRERDSFGATQNDFTTHGFIVYLLTPKVSGVKVPLPQ
jgi:hypothetical protein